MPEQAIAGVDAGCHVYCAKPIAVDVPGCQTIAEAGRKGTEKNRVVLIDFQTRTSEFYQEAVRRVHAGDIGNVVSGEAVYYGGQVWGGGYDPNNPESKIRAWGLDRILSGDTITEQFIHALDVATWIIDAAPLKAYGGVRQERPQRRRHVQRPFQRDLLVPQGRAPELHRDAVRHRLRRHRLPHVRLARNDRYALLRHRRTLSGRSRTRAASTATSTPTGRSATSPRSTRRSARATAPTRPCRRACGAT